MKNLKQIFGIQKLMFYAIAFMAMIGLACEIPGGNDNGNNNSVGAWSGSYAITISDGDIYVAGKIYDIDNKISDKACYWKNGVRIGLK